MVPAFTGLGASYWDRDARAAIYGLTVDSGLAEIVRGLESIAYQTRDLFEAMAATGRCPNGASGRWRTRTERLGDAVPFR